VIGTTIGPYRVLRELGQGGMGTVVLAEDTRLGRHVALKTVSGAQAGTSGGRAQLLDEARAAAALTHPAIAAVHDVIEHDGNIAIVFELVEGETLAARLAKGPLPEPLAVTIAVQIADALAVAHGARVLHRDLKPSNIMLAPGGVVKILDFGIARFRPVGHDQPAGKDGDEGFMGTPGYVPPEQWTGKAVDERADLYALGVVLFEMLTGKRPFPARTVHAGACAIDRIACRVSSLRPGVSPALDRRWRGCSPPIRRCVRARRVVADELRSLLAPLPPRRRRGKVGRRGVVLAVAGGRRGGGCGRCARRAQSGDCRAAARQQHRRRVERLSRPGSRQPVTSLPRSVGHDALARWWRVSARFSTPSAIARDLGATLLVDGTVQRQDDKLNIAISLVCPTERRLERSGRGAGPRRVRHPGPAGQRARERAQRADVGRRRDAPRDAADLERQRARCLLARPRAARTARHAG
jgi:serine/threonine protein kinase